MKANFWVLACLLALLAPGSQAALAVGYFKNPDYPGKCYIDEKTILDEGQTITQKGCRRVICGGEGMVQFATCGISSVEPPCYLGAIKYPNDEYPKCCIRIAYCPDFVGEA